jgi:beta-lactamase regulating signal transducer with metallopeptidase domain
MILLQLQDQAQVAVAHLLNSLPEGILIALFVALTLRFLPRQNSGTRFAVWFMALLAVVALPFAGTLANTHPIFAMGSSGPLLTISDHWALLLFISWMVLTGFALLRLAAGIVHVRRLLKSCVAIETVNLEPSIRKVITEFASLRSVTLATSERMTVPAAIGFTKPTIVLPRWALRELPAEDLNIILLHEFAHIHRWDGWTNLLQKLVRAIFCFHPAVWWIESRLSLEREMACDDYVLAETNDSCGYAKCLIGLLERRLTGNALAMAQAAVRRAHEATLRVAQILDVNRAKTKRIWKPALALVGVFSVACLIILPDSRQLVGFAPNETANKDAIAASLPAVATPFAARVIPAGMRETSFETAPKRPHVKAHAAKKRPMTNSQTLMARAEKSLAPARVVTVSGQETSISVQRTILVIRTTDQIGPNSWQCSIRVWQLRLVPGPAQSVPATASKT